MANLPSIEVLESTHDFPTSYTFKVIGLAADGFVERVLSSVQSEFEEAGDISHRTKETSGGKHVSVTIEPTVHSAKQVLAVYTKLHELDGLVLLL